MSSNWFSKELKWQKINMQTQNTRGTVWIITRNWFVWIKTNKTFAWPVGNAYKHSWKNFRWQQHSRIDHTRGRSCLSSRRHGRLIAQPISLTRKVGEANRKVSHFDITFFLHAAVTPIQARHHLYAAIFGCAYARHIDQHKLFRIADIVEAHGVPKKGMKPKLHK